MESLSIIKSVVLFLFLGMTSNVFAVVCNEKSPDFINEGDGYYKIEKSPPLTSDQSKDIRNIFEKFMKKLEGNKLFTDCVREDGKDIIQVKKYKIKGRITDGFTGGYDFSFTEELTPGRYIYTKLNAYIHPDTHFLIGSITSNSFELIAKYHSAHGRGNTHLVEERSMFVVDGKSLIINTVSYINGYFASESIIRIK